MKILILGVNGFIGHHLSNRILETTDWEVYGMDMRSDRLSEEMKHDRFHFFEAFHTGLSLFGFRGFGFEAIDEAFKVFALCFLFAAHRH